MNWMDELRSIVTGMVIAHDDENALRKCIGAFNVWLAAHDLVDLATCGPQCPAWRVMVGAPRCMATFEMLTPEEDPDYDARIENAPVGQPCPVMAARREAT